MAVVVRILSRLFCLGAKVYLVDRCADFAGDHSDSHHPAGMFQ